MSTEKEMGATQQVIPDEIQALFGKPPLLYNESAGQYARLLSKIALAIDPQGVIEWFWVKDIADLLWEIRRLRRIKALIISAGIKKGLADLFRVASDKGELTPEAATRHGAQLARDFIGGGEKAKIEARALFEKEGLDEDSIAARAFILFIKELEITDRLLAAVEIRRDKVLREIEFRRETVGRRVREIAVAESDKALRLPGPKGPNDIHVPDELSHPPEAKGA